MAKNLKEILARKLAENSQRHAVAQQETEFEAGRQHVKLAIDCIDPNPYQPRRLFSQEELESLAASISETGLLQPISVRKTGERYQIIAGERRWRAHRLLGRPSIEALVMAAEDSDMAVYALAENIDRADLSDYEIGKALRQIENLFPTKRKLAESLGMNREDMYRYFAFDALPESIRARLDENPRLFSRSAATELKRFLQDNRHPELSERLAEAWTLLERGELEQTKLVGHLDRATRAGSGMGGEGAGRSARGELFRAGRKMGSITRSAREVVIRLKAECLSEAQEQELRRYLERLPAEPGLTRSSADSPPPIPSADIADG